MSDSLRDAMDYTVQGIRQAVIPEGAALPFSGSSQPKDRTQVSRIAGGFFTSWTTRAGLWSHLNLAKFCEKLLKLSRVFDKRNRVIQKGRDLGWKVKNHHQNSNGIPNQSWEVNSSQDEQGSDLKSVGIEIFPKQITSFPYPLSEICIKTLFRWYLRLQKQKRLEPNAAPLSHSSLQM